MWSSQNTSVEFHRSIGPARSLPTPNIWLVARLHKDLVSMGSYPASDTMAGFRLLSLSVYKHSDHIRRYATHPRQVQLGCDLRSPAALMSRDPSPNNGSSLLAWRYEVCVVRRKQAAAYNTCTEWDVQQLLWVFVAGEAPSRTSVVLMLMWPRAAEHAIRRVAGGESVSLHTPVTPFFVSGVGVCVGGGGREGGVRS